MPLVDAETECDKEEPPLYSTAQETECDKEEPPLYHTLFLCPVSSYAFLALACVCSVVQSSEVTAT